MIAEEMVRLGEKRSSIRDAYEYGRQRASLIGEENVFDFSLGNPHVPAPPGVRRAIRQLLEQEDDIELFGYTPAQGLLKTRQAIAADLNSRFGASFGPENLYITCGAAAGIRIITQALTVPGDEYIVFTPYFPEYRVFVEDAGGKLVEARTREEDFQIDFPELERAVTENTKAVFLNSPNNPSGVVTTEKNIIRLAALLSARSKAYGHPIYLVGDEPYRELVYDGVNVPWLTKYYPDTLVCYSYSKSLSIPGERAGYILVPDEATYAEKLYAAVCGAGRALGYVCAPSLVQHVVAECAGHAVDLGAYKKNRDLLYHALQTYGYTCIRPDGAFYLFIRTPLPDSVAFCEYARKYELLLVPGDDFGCPGYARIAYCVPARRIERALPLFKKLAEDFGKEENLDDK